MNPGSDGVVRTFPLQGVRIASQSPMCLQHGARPYKAAAPSWRPVFLLFFGGGVARNEEETREEMQESTEQILTGRRCCCVGWTGCGPLMCSGLQRQIMLTNTFHEMKLETKFLK